MVLVVPPEEADEVLDALDAVLVGVVLHLQQKQNYRFSQIHTIM